MNQLFKSSIGRKYLVGVTGVFLIIFVIVHLLGNLQVFVGPKAVNDYAKLLKSMPALLWGARIGLLATFAAHIFFAIQLKLESMAARPEPYAFENTVQATVSSRIMALSGTLILLYVIGHLLHFTLGVILPQYAHLQTPEGHHDVYRMMVSGFQIPFVSVLYIAAMCLLWSHLSHGISSVFQTLGFRTVRNKKFVDSLGPIISTVLVLGYISIPVAILAGIVR